jgi:hypothetical protein
MMLPAEALIRFLLLRDHISGAVVTYVSRLTVTLESASSGNNLSVPFFSKTARAFVKNTQKILPGDNNAQHIRISQFANARRQRQK